MNKTQLKEIILQEFNSLREGKYELYHKTFTAAATEARKLAEKQGYEIDDDSWTTEVTFNGKYTRARPSIGKTNRFTIDLHKNGKPQRKQLQFQVYGMEGGKFELNAYVA